MVTYAPNLLAMDTLQRILLIYSLLDTVAPNCSGKERQVRSKQNNMRQKTLQRSDNRDCSSQGTATEHSSARRLHFLPSEFGVL